VAGKTGYWARRKEFWSVNVDGTRSVLEAVRAAGVRRLVYTSTPSVVGYAHDVDNGGPDLPYAAIHEGAYPESKAEAERLVLAANGSRVATVVVRPHLIVGPGDHQMMPRVVQRAAQGRLRIIGDGRNRVDLTYIDNAAWAHLDAADALTGHGAACAGKAYFISNGQPVLLWEWLNRLLQDLGLPPVTRSLSLQTARVAATAAEMLWRAFRVRGEPPITRFLASALARSHWYDLEPARRDLGYRIRVPMEEATRRTARWLAERLELGGAAESSLRLTASRIGTSPLPERPRVCHIGKRSPRS
jgi:nucleoside-diphosphate-sugar epimerase